MEWRVFRNTYLQGPLWLYRLVVRDKDYEQILNGSAPRSQKVDRILRRLLWFWPRIGVADIWADAQVGGALGPENYLHYEPTRLVKKTIEVIPRSSSILELGCNSGSDLDLLRKAGFHRLSGMDAGRHALDLFSEEFPETYDLVGPDRDLFQRYLLNAQTNSFDYVYSNGATIELVHPSFPIVKEICRVARYGVLLDLSERVNGFARDYERQFERSGFTLWYTDRKTDPRVISQIYFFLHEALRSPR